MYLIENKHNISQITVLQKYFSQNLNSDSITSIRTYNRNHSINLKKLHSCLDKIKNKELKTCFQKKKVLLSTPYLCQLLTTAKFERLPIPKQTKQVGFFPCANCVYHKNGYFRECLSFSFKSKNKLLTWYYKRFLSCDSKDVLYVLICINCGFFYIGQTEELKPRTRKKM